jgi:hypothetical protein
MKPQAVLEVLNHIHSVSMLPVWFEGVDDSGRYVSVYGTLSWVAKHPDLTAADAEQLAGMLLWEEFKNYRDASCRLAILRACERFPRDRVREILRMHLSVASSQHQVAQFGTHEYADLSEEVRRISRLLDLS